MFRSVSSCSRFKPLQGLRAAADGYASKVGNNYILRLWLAGGGGEELPSELLDEVDEETGVRGRILQAQLPDRY